MSTLTEQEVFDTVVNGLRAQGCQSILRNGMCAYRGGNGNKCAAGMIILDSEFNSDMEGIGIDTLLRGHEFCPQSMIDRLRPHVALIGALQSTHDSPVQNWEAGFKRIATRWNLTYTEPK